LAGVVGDLARLHPPRGIPRDDVRERPAHVHAYPHALSHALCLSLVGYVLGRGRIERWV
jgi:hypothetical protein